MKFTVSALILRCLACLTLAATSLPAQEAAPSATPAPEAIASPTPSATPEPEATPALAPAVAPTAAVPAPAAESATEPADFQNVRVRVTGPAEAQNVTEALRLQVKVSNRTGEEIVIRQVRWELPPAVVATRGAGTGTPPWLSGTTTGVPATMASGAELLYDLALPAIAEPGWKLPLNPKLIGFKPHDYPIKIAVEYEAGAQKRRSIEEETLPVKFDTTPWFYLWGGVAGSLIGVIFEFFYSIVRGIESYRWPKTQGGWLSIGRVLLDLLTYLIQWLIGGTIKFFTGALTAALVLLVLYYYKDVPLPITIQINDFLGAAVIGLFTHRLGLWAYDSFFTPAPKVVVSAVKTTPTGMFSVEQLPPSLSYTDEK